MAKRKKKRAATKPKAKRPKATKPITRKAPPRTKAKLAPRKPAPKKAPRRTPSKPSPVKRPKAPKLSQTKAARAARERRAFLRAEAEARRARRTKQQKKRRKEKRRQRGIGEYALAREWLEAIRERMTEAFDVTLTMTEEGGGSADLAVNEGEEAAALEEKTSWLIVGRFDPEEPISYATLASGFQLVENDLILGVRINGQRLSQVRVVFHDPNETRHEGDSVISKIGPWEYVTGDLIGELVGANLENPTEGSLAARYKETSVPAFYIFFSSEIMAPRNVFSGRGGTTTIPWSSKRQTPKPEKAKQRP